MGGHDHRYPVGRKGRDALPKFAAGKGIGPAGRLVQKKNFGPMQEGGRHGQTLFVSAR
jgi:hypothetical protein